MIDEADSSFFRPERDPGDVWFGRTVLPPAQTFRRRASPHIPPLLPLPPARAAAAEEEEEEEEEREKEAGEEEGED